MSNKYSVIIPTFNEKYFISRNIERIKLLFLDAEIIVSDGGSFDGTIEVCKQYGVKIVKSGLGRGQQLNAGASIASGDILIFLHADTFLPGNAAKILFNAFSDEKVKVARFKVSFDFNNKLLDFYSKFSKFNTRFTRFGDSAIIVRKDFFKNLNGFSNRETFEDVDFFKRTSKLTKIFLIDAYVSSSARRFIKVGVFKQQLLNILLFIGYIFRVNSKTLSRLYNKSNKVKVKKALILFLRYPKAGTVKTRLAETTSSDFAVNFYRSCAEKIVGIAKSIEGINRFAFYSNNNEKQVISDWLGNKLFFSVQEGDDLGSRMKNAFEKVFSSGSEKVIIVGTDIPDLSKKIIEQAFNSIEENDVVIGPSKDGGYYLLGMKKMVYDLFGGIEFSNDKVYSKTIKKLNNLNLRYDSLPLLQDIDTEEDLINWLNEKSNNKIKKEIKLAYKTI